MKCALMLLGVGLLTGSAFAQDPAASKPMGATLTEIPAGTALAAELSKSLDARKAKPGDPVVARTTQDMLANGKVVIPHDSKITGHVTEAQGRPKGQKGDANSSLGIVFDQLTLKGGTEVPFHAVIQAMAKPIVTAPPIAGTGLPSGGYGGSVSGGGGYGGSPSGGGGYGQGSVGQPTGTQRASTEPEAADNGQGNSAGYPGAISVQTQGVIGIKGYALSDNDQGSVITSTIENVKLEGGTQLILKAKGK